MGPEGVRPGDQIVNRKFNKEAYQMCAIRNWKGKGSGQMAKSGRNHILKNLIGRYISRIT